MDILIVMDLMNDMDGIGDLPELELVRALTPRTEARERDLEQAHVAPDIAAALKSCQAGDDNAFWLVQQLILSGHLAVHLTHCLHKAVSSGNEILVGKLLAIGIPFDTCVIRVAIDKSLLDTLSLFISQGWDINEACGWCTPPLLSYALFIEARDSVISWFLDHGAHPNANCIAGLTPLSTAVAVAPLRTIQRCLDHCAADTVFGGQLLHCAARRNDDISVQVVELVLRRCRCNVNSIELEDNKFTYECWRVTGLGTPLHEAAKGGHPGVAKLLLYEGADIAIKDTRGETAIQVAKTAGNVQVVQVLREAENWNKPTNKAET